MEIPILPTRIHAVTVFRRGAMITRRGVVLAVEGRLPAEVRVIGLPLCLDDGSVRARLRTGNAVATGLQVSLTAPGQPSEPCPLPTDDEILAARIAVMRLRGLHDRTRPALEAMVALRAPDRPAPAPGHPPPPSPTQARLELLEFRRAQIARLEEELDRLGEDLRRANEHLAELEQRRRRETTDRPVREDELRKSVRVTLAGHDAPAEEIELEVDYLVPGARWVPAYGLEVGEDGAHAQLAVRALVGQATGEDWSTGPMVLRHVAVPRESSDVFRVIEMCNSLDAPLLPGPVDISVNGEFRLTSRIGTVPPRGRLEIGAGVEPALKVARNARFREELNGVITSSLRLRHDITVDVANHLGRAAALEVRERIPVPAAGR